MVYHILKSSWFYHETFQTIKVDFDGVIKYYLNLDLIYCLTGPVYFQVFNFLRAQKKLAKKKIKESQQTDTPIIPKGLSKFYSPYSADITKIQYSYLFPS